MFSRIPNRRIEEFCLVFKNIAKTVHFHKERRFAAPLKENKKLWEEIICEFVDSEFVEICHEDVPCLLIRILVI